MVSDREQPVDDAGEADVGPSASIEQNASTGLNTSSIVPTGVLSEIFDPNSFLGKVLDGRFLVEQLIGQGGNGTIFAATDIKQMRRVAVKVLTDNRSTSVRRFNQETRTARCLRHPSIVEVFHYGVESNHPFYAMELVSGTPLTALINKKPLGLHRSMCIIEEVCEALIYAHSQGVVHRDVKPSNIMIESPNDLVKIVDFGVAKRGDWDVGDDDSVTRTGEIFGTPLYLSPEQANGKQCDGRSDIYSLGCVFYECLVGTPPHVGSTPIEILMKHKKAVVVPPSQAHPSGGYPEAIDLIVLKMLAKKPINRYQSVAALLSDLQAFRAGTLNTSHIVLFEQKPFVHKDTPKAISSQNV